MDRVLVSRQALRVILRTLLRRGGGILLRDKEEAEAADALFKAAYGTTTVEPAKPVTVKPVKPVTVELVEPSFEPAKKATTVKRKTAKRK